MADTARLTSLLIRQVQDGAPGYKLENPFGQTIQVLPRPPGQRPGSRKTTPSFGLTSLILQNGCG